MADIDLRLTEFAPQPPPKRQVQWMRAWFGTPGNTIITLLCAGALLMLGKHAIDWLLINATFVGTPADCKAVPAHAGRFSPPSCVTCSSDSIPTRNSGGRFRR